MRKALKGLGVHQARAEMLAHAVETDPDFEMSCFTRGGDCGTPVCVAGHVYAFIRNERGSVIRNLHEIASHEAHEWLTGNAAANIYEELFHSSRGCGSVGYNSINGKQAAAYLRQVWAPQIHARFGVTPFFSRSA